MKATLSILALAGAVAADYGYAAPVSSSKAASSSAKPYGWKPSSSVAAAPVKSSAKPTWGDDEECDEWGHPVAAAASVKPTYGAKASYVADACAPYTVVKTGLTTVTKTVPGGVATFTKDGHVTTETFGGKVTSYVKTIPGSTVTVTTTLPGGVAVYTKDGVVITTTYPANVATYTKEVSYTTTETITSTFANNVVTYTADGMVVTKTLGADNVATYTKTSTGCKTVTVTTKLPNVVATYTKTLADTYSTFVGTEDPVVYYTTSDVYTQTVTPDCKATQAAPVAQTWGAGQTWGAAPAYSAAPVAQAAPVATVVPGSWATGVKPAYTSTKAYSPVMATANAAVQNGMAGAAMLAAAAVAFI